MLYGGGMRRLVSSVCIAAALLMSGCTGARVDPHRLAKLDGNGHIYDLMLGYMVISNNSHAYLLGKVLQQCGTYLPERNVYIYLYERDCRLTESPMPLNVLSNADFLAIAAATNDQRQVGSLNGNWANAMLLDCINVVGENTGAYAMDTYSDSTNLFFHIGPEEIVQYGWQRQAYRVPESLRDRFKTLPAVLPPRGACMGFDPEKSILVVIDGEWQNVFTVLPLIGCEPIGECRKGGDCRVKTASGK
jgi:hypothetical protein